MSEETPSPAPQECPPTPDSLPADAAGQSVAVPPPPKSGDVPVLQKLSSPPFPRSGFPLLGIMETVYEHVMAVAARGETRDRSRAPAEPAQHL